MITVLTPHSRNIKSRSRDGPALDRGRTIKFCTLVFGAGFGGYLVSHMAHDGSSMKGRIETDQRTDCRPSNEGGPFKKSPGRMTGAKSSDNARPDVTGHFLVWRENRSSDARSIDRILSDHLNSARQVSPVADAGSIKRERVKPAGGEAQTHSSTARAAQ